VTKAYYTTSQAAKLLSVSSDTVLKWVRAGKITSYRTPGGHARIPAEAIQALLPNDIQVELPVPQEVETYPYRYCWDFYAGEDGVRQACRNSVVYKSQARRCYEMRDIPEEFGHLKLFCEESCEECEFYHLTHQQARSALIVSRSTELLERLSDQAARLDLDIRVAANEYESALVIEQFRPDFIVLDCSFGTVRTKEFCRQLSTDERIPFAKIILASRTAKWDEECEAEVFAWIKKPFSIEQLSELIAGAAVN
jgi:excisionase family DNA binding protein